MPGKPPGGQDAGMATTQTRTQPAAPAATQASETTGVLALPGAGLVYKTAGRGPAVVLVHGFGLDLRMWDAQAAALASRFQVVRYDCRGFGASGPLDPRVPYTHADDLIALLDHLGLARAALAGLSFGGRVVMQAALQAPGRVRGLALLGAVLDGIDWDAESAAAMDEVSRQVAAGGVLAGRAAWLAHPLFAAAREQPELAGELAAIVAGYPGQHWLGQDPHRSGQPELISVLEQLARPALVAVGERDVPCFRVMSQVLAERLPGAQYQVIPGAGHMINMERPAAVSDLLTGFLASLPTDQPAA
jgi:3-oxoadipate enol-lactonase